MTGRRQAIALLVLLACALGAQAQETAGVAVLETSSYWRTHYSLMHPLYLKGGALTKMPLDTRGCKNAWVAFPTALPPKDWAAADFDDGGWLRLAGLMTAGTDKGSDPKSPLVGLECLRGKFHVAETAAAQGLTLSLEYRGGIVVYLNGKEIARAHLAKGPDLEALAEPTQPGEKAPRRLENLPLPPALLRKGVNVLAVECHRAPYLESEITINETKWPQGIVIPRASCGVESIRLGAPAAALKAVTPNVARPAGFQVWNSDLTATDFDMDYGDPNEPLRPIRIVGARGGAFSGKVVVGSTAPLKGLKGVVSDLVSADGKGRIPAERVQVRYAMPDGIEACADARYLAAWGAGAVPNPEDPRAYKRAAITPTEVLGMLLESPPAEVPVYAKSFKPAKNAPAPPAATPPVFGAVAGVWVTVSVPATAPPGQYEGTLTITAAGQKPAAAPVSLTVCNWTLSDPSQWRSFIEVVESPESLALAYDVPLWSDEHFRLIDAAFRQLGRVGNKAVYIPLICQTNMGNAESLVRWRKQADGAWAPDFTVLDRYLDAVEKGMGKPAVVCFYLWDSFLDRTLGGRGDEKWEPEGQKAAIAGAKGHGPEVTVVGAAQGESGTREMPPYGSAEAKKAWEPAARGITERMEKRGLKGAMVLGLMCDYMPTKESALGIIEIFPGVPWASMAHWWPRPLYGVPVTYKANVFTGDDEYRDPSQRRFHGWNNPELRCHFPRLLREYFPLNTFRLAEEMSFQTNYRGIVRFGADFWPVLKNRRGDRVGSLAGRYPKSFWNNLNIEVNLLSEGPQGPVANARLEAIREGLQECEARIAVERALVDPALRAKLDLSQGLGASDALAAKCQALLDERTRQIRHGLSTLMASGHYAGWAWEPECWWHRPAVVGHHYYIGSGWQQRSAELFTAAGAVQR